MQVSGVGRVYGDVVFDGCPSTFWVFALLGENYNVVLGRLASELVFPIFGKNHAAAF